MNQKTLVLIVVAVVIVAGIGVGAYYIMIDSGNGDNIVGVEDATSLQYIVDATYEGSTGTYTYLAKNIGTDDMMIRIEFTITELDFVYTVNSALQEAWAYDGEWQDLSATFSDEWDLWASTFEETKDNLSEWTSGDWSYTHSDGSAMTVYDVVINPILADSLFGPDA